MVWIIILAVIGVLAILAALLFRSSDGVSGIAVFGGAIALIVAAVLFIMGSFYTQDHGDASVVVGWDGNIVGQNIEPGVHNKWPWQDVHSFNVRNQLVSFVNDGQSDNAGNVPTGPQITVQDQDGVSSNIDIALRYSIRPDQVTNVYKQFKTEDNFKASFVQQDVRAAVRSVPGQFKTIDLLTKRNDVEKAIQDSVEQRWNGSGVSVDSVSLQEIRIPDSVKESYAEAQKSQIQVQKAQNDLAAAKVSAQQQVVQAEAKAKANDLLAKSLTAPVLQQNYIDTLRSLGASGNVVVVPQGSNPLLNVGGK